MTRKNRKRPSKNRGAQATGNQCESSISLNEENSQEAENFDNESSSDSDSQSIDHDKDKEIEEDCSISNVTTNIFNSKSETLQKNLSASLGKEDSPVTPEKEDSPVAPEKEDSPVAPEKEDSPVAPEKEGSPVAPEKEGSPVAPEKEGSPVAPEKEGSPKIPILSSNISVSLTENNPVLLVKSPSGTSVSPVKLDEMAKLLKVSSAEYNSLRISDKHKNIYEKANLPIDIEKIDDLYMNMEEALNKFKSREITSTITPVKSSEDDSFDRSDLELKGIKEHEKLKSNTKQKRLENESSSQSSSDERFKRRKLDFENNAEVISNPSQASDSLKNSDSASIANKESPFVSDSAQNDPKKTFTTNIAALALSVFVLIPCNIISVAVVVMKDFYKMGFWNSK